jgi:Ca-activated chloride channel family protein
VITDWFKHIEFKYPFLLWLLLLLPVLLWWYYTNRSHIQAAIPVSSFRDIPKNRSFRIMLRHLPFWLRMMALVCIILAMARPQIKFQEERVSGEGIDIVLCLDVSGSMLAQDFQPNRLEAAKEVATKFIDGRATDRIGLVIFAGESFTMCPLTTDYGALKAQVYNIRSGLLEDGTAIGSGLATAVDRLKNSPSKSRIVVLLTDGENNTGFAPLTAKEIAKSLKIRVYTIGVGTEGFAPVPEINEQGQITMQQQKVNIDEKFLRELAFETEGKYFRARDNQGLSNIYAEIDQLEKTKVEVTKLNHFTEKFYPLVFAAIFFLLLEIILSLTVFRKFP